MLTLNSFIDTFQHSKKLVANQLFKDAALNKAAIDYIDTQTAFAKMLTNNAMTVAKYSVDTMTNLLYPKKEQAAQAPYKVEPKTRKTKVEEAANTDINTQGE